MQKRVLKIHTVYGEVEMACEAQLVITKNMLKENQFFINMLLVHSQMV